MAWLIANLRQAVPGEAVDLVDHSLAVGDHSMLLRGELACEMEHSRDVGMAVIERQEI